ncbi:MAG: hypothetical protein O3C68_07345 [Proteobacteria bacterium]|nr:hypothetical protein [Pseudomonadota bacterium]
MSAEIRSVMGWQRILVLENNDVELLVTLDVGPRIISYRRQGGQNIFKTFDDQLGKSGEADWQIRGGHRLWIAPESASTCFPDNQPVSYEVINENHVYLRTPAEAESGIRKVIEIILDEETSRVQVNHYMTATRTLSYGIAPWSLTVLKPGGKAVIPMPNRSLHPNDLPPNEKTARRDADQNLLPNRNMSLWAYTDMGDPRFNWCEDRLEITQDANMPSTKLGLLHRMKIAHYEVDGCRFSKTIDYLEDATYPDGNCNLEIFTDGSMLELESLGPLVVLNKGERIVHTENWSLERLRPL